MTPPDSDATSTSERAVPGEAKARSFKPLPFWPRMAVLSVGWCVILVGIAGLVLPGPGTLALIAGAAILSVASEVAYKGLRSACKRWPALWARFESLRSRIHDRVHGFFHRDHR
jgi:hypothetical protein